MKKISICLAMAVFGLAGLNSCGDSSDKGGTDTLADTLDTVAALDDSAQTPSLTAEEYSKMIKYVGEYAEKAQVYLDQQNADPTSAEAAEGLKTLAEEYPDLDAYRSNIANAPVGSMSEDNINEMGKYAGLIEFTVPSWYEIQTADPNTTAGLIVETPSESETANSGVVAQPEETVQIKK